ncbi:SDR family oxidoreductase [Aestuariibius sp. 2305UL40-4]|uniref:SDR family oxidoreductase n=1 Tax=Aestuariibius violaceus TaxID=3234132 RepID=UPI00345EF716
MTKDSQKINRRQALRGAGFAGIGAFAAGVTPASAQGADSARPLAGKAAIVTGARNNMGRAFAVELARMGADVAIHYHRAETRDQAEETAQLVREAGGRAVLSQGDLGDSANVTALYDAAEQAFGGVDIAVNTAGTIIKKPVAEFTDADFERLQNDNVATMFYSMREAARRLRDGGRIINVGTSLTAGTAPGYAGYAGTKAPVEEFTRILARELGERRITVNTIAPGPIDTPFFHAAETPQTVAYAAGLSTEGRLGAVEDLVPQVAFLAHPDSQWVNGQNLFINGGYLTR